VTEIQREIIRKSISDLFFGMIP